MAYKILIIDLENENTRLEYVEDEISNFYLGGLGLSYYYLSQNPKTNPFMVFTSAIISYPNPICKYIIMAKDESGNISYGTLGGNFSYYLKTNSYDGLVLLGKAKDKKEIFIDANTFIRNYEKEKEPSFQNLKEKYGQDISSIYISKSAIKGDKLSRLRVDEYQGISRGLANILLAKNVVSINVKKNNLREIKTPKIYEENPNRNCPGCLLGCFEKRYEKKGNIFSTSEINSTSENQKLEEIKKILDAYGIDIFALSRSIEFAYENLNHIYKFKNLQAETLDMICKNIVEDKREEIYKDLIKGRDFLAEKYGIETTSKKTKNKNSNIDIIDSAGLCLFAVNPKDLSNISQTINKLSDKNYSEDDLENLINEIEKIKSSLK
ncbi:aldehyde ferredoxin oxidoreductase N-terminal domain-containing protein [Anaerococcus sp. Marseille-P3625]|uniref:aldehyde ferredoxin oxidoreductase N-terminal domain-containing protein n=1 Tax=Anaerococcus sp. Marseille-P3625 TaxID=1977277 RepID=UPI000C089429|nr:aldehyde ferredoxin oxidoreductase N-terminal domain-containing protein [Anaerococcus sp. Marseille-P3625]